MSRCCGTSVGVIVEDTTGRLLMITRGWYPTGIAPVAGHIADAHTDAADALVAEVGVPPRLEPRRRPPGGWGHLPGVARRMGLPPGVPVRGVPPHRPACRG